MSLCWRKLLYKKKISSNPWNYCLSDSTFFPSWIHCNSALILKPKNIASKTWKFSYYYIVLKWSIKPAMTPLNIVVFNVYWGRA